MSFKKAVKQQQKLRMGLQGAAGSGKTMSALKMAKGMSNKIAVIDTEHGSASLYSDKFDFDVMEIRPPFTPEAYIKAIEEAEKAGYEILIIDSITQEWNGEGGCLDIVNKIGGNSYVAWKTVTPRHEKFINKILSANLHIICTMRSKSQYETGKSDSGKMVIEKIGTKAIQREDTDFELTTVLLLNKNHMASSDKDRTGLFDNIDFIITEETGKKLLEWLNSGAKLKEELPKTPLHNTVNLEKPPAFDWIKAKDEISELVKKVGMKIEVNKSLYFKNLPSSTKPYSEMEFKRDKAYLLTLFEPKIENSNVSPEFKVTDMQDDNLPKGVL